MSDRAKQVVIVGGGIGGLSAAIALRRAGFDATVFERAPELKEVGAGISVWPNAGRMLKKWGVLDSVVRRGTVVTVAEMKDPRGRVLTRMPLRRQDAPHVLIHRADLLASLAEALPPWAVHLDAEFERFEEEEDGADGRVRARFGAWGTAEGDALVGADGLWSRVRAQVLGDGAPVYRGYPVWRGVARMEHPAAPAHVISETLGRGLRVGLVPLGGGRTAWWATANEPQGTDDGGERGRKAKLLRLFGGWHAPVPALIEATPDDEILKNDVFDRPPSRGWSRGRVTLLGDAAHPTTPNLGQGGCMAIEDAAVLARCMTATADVRAALRDFEARRYARTRAITLQSLLYGKMGQWSDAAAVWVREMMFRLTPAPLAARSMERMFAFDV